MRCLRFVLSFAASVVLLASALQAQVSSVAPRILTPVNEQSLTTLRGNISPVARAEFDKGEASPSELLRNVRLVLTRSKEQQAELDSFMAAQLDKNSPDYHHWLTPSEFDRRFGPADSDIAAIVAWLQSNGLSVEPGTASSTNIAFSGTISQIEKAFHTSIHAFQRNGVGYFANVTEPKIPTALATVVSGVAQLSTYAPIPHMVKSRDGMFSPGAGFSASDSASRLARPDLTTTGGGSFLWITPADAATMYDTPNAYNAAFSSGSSFTGKGVTIGIGGVADIQTSTVVNYRSRFLNGDLTAPTVTNIDNSAIIGNATDEAYIDNELAGGVAPGATIHFYTADNNDGGLVTVMNQVIKDNSVDIFSLSFGLCEYYLTNAQNQLIYSLMQQMSTLGIAVTVSTGDSGAAGCDDPSQASASLGLQVNGFGSTPFNIAVGGTDTYALLSNFSTYANTNQSSTNSYRSALSFIPESTWNNSPVTDGLLANNVPSGYVSSSTNIVGGSGGVSSCSTQNAAGSVCLSGYPKPSWQRGPGVPNDNARDLPDVSLMGGNGNDSATWLICTDENNSLNYPEDCSTQGNSQFYFSGFGGTSTSAPAFAGMLALVQESLGGSGHRLGADAAKTLYDLFNGSNASVIFHDTTQGNISVYCAAASPDCKTNTAGYTFLTGYDTTTGYDLATGMGSVDATNLVKFWSGASGSTSSTVMVTPSATSITTAQSLKVNVTVSGGNGTPTGTVSLSGGGYTSSTVTLDGTGKATFNIPAGALAVGTDTLTVTYSGDTTYASTTGTTSVTVTQVLLTPTVIVTPAISSIYVDQPLGVNVTVTGTGATPTGTVTLSSGNYTSAATTLSGGSAMITIPKNSLTAGTATLTASYSGDTAYKTASGTGSVTVTARLTPTVAVAPAATSIYVDQPLGVNVTVAGTGATPTGTVTLSSGSYTSAATALSGGSATITIPKNSLAVGTATLTASYSGDTEYATASGTGSVTVAAKTTATVAVTPASPSIYVDQPLGVNVTVAGTGVTPTGTVTLSSGSYTSAATALSGGSATITIPKNSLAAGTATLTASYSGDTVYGSASGSGSVTVTKLSPTVSVTPASSAIDSAQPLDVTVKVTGTGATPTGTVSLTGGGYTSAATALSGGSATITIPGNTFSASGAVTLTGSYSGDAAYASGSGTGSVTINAPYSLTGTAPAAVSPGGSATSTITVKSDGVYAGTVAMSCSLTNSPSGAQDVPTCSVTSGSSLTFDSSHTSQTSTVTFNTTAATSASLDRRGLPRWTATGGAVLALLFFIGMPARRRSWRSLLGLLVLISALASLSACGGSSSTTGGGNPGTTAGTYTFTVTGAGTPAFTPAPTTTVNLTVN
jgi:hypothetical protein